MVWNLDLNTIVLALVGAMTLINTYYTRRTEKNTNSMKDALVASTGQLAHAAGKEEGRIEGEVKAAAVAEGVAQMNKEKS